MTTTFDRNEGTKQKKNTRNERLSLDGKWRSFPKVPNLFQYINTGRYFARLKVQGKTIRRGIKAATFEEAKLALHDFITDHHEPEAGLGTFGGALKMYLRAVNVSHDLAPETKRYRRYCVKALLASWPGLRLTPVRKIALEDCQDWAARFAAAKDEQYFNNTLSVLRSVLELGGIGKDKNPARKIKRLGVKQKELKLPEPDQFNRMVEIVETSGAGQAQDCADLIRFLAFSGCRISEARRVFWSDVDMGRAEIRVWNAKRTKRSNAPETRQVPIIPPMRELLQRLKQDGVLPTARVCVLGECERSLERACKLAGAFRLTHHDLRHLFATRCIESGVDVPTVSRWLGHSDGGALAMKTYGHLRREHSAAMAQRVTFDSAPASKIIPMPQETIANIQPR
jgi:integrase